MANTASSLMGKQRSNLSHAYHVRGKKNHNLWLVYSVKTDKDWILCSDRQLVYWIYQLETNPEVLSYELNPSPFSSLVNEKNLEIEVDAVVKLKNKLTEWHKLQSDRVIQNEKLDDLRTAASQMQATYRLFSDEDLKRSVSAAMKWLKVISYAASIRGRAYKHTEYSLMTALRKQKGGLVEDLLTSLKEEEEAVLMGLLGRLSINGTLYLDLGKNVFGRRTPWCLNEEVPRYG